MEINCPSCNEAVLITDEDMAATVECPFCQQRFEFDKPEPPPVKEPPPIIQPQSSTSERTYLECDGLKVTDKRVIMRNRTYACKQITSVGIAHDFLGEQIPKLLFGKPAWAVVTVSWLVTVIISVCNYWLWMKFGETPVTIGASLLSLGFGLIAFIITLVWLSTSANRHKRYWIEIATASGREQAMQCVSEESAQAVCNAINAAIIDS